MVDGTPHQLALIPSPHRGGLPGCPRPTAAQPAGVPLAACRIWSVPFVPSLPFHPELYPEHGAFPARLRAVTQAGVNGDISSRSFCGWLQSSPGPCRQGWSQETPVHPWRA